MTHAREMVDTYPGTAALNVAALVECIEACFDCAQSCSACADACLGEEEVSHLRRCITMCLNCSDVCATTGRIVSRQTEFRAGDGQGCSSSVCRSVPLVRRGVRAPRQGDEHGALSGVRRGLQALRASLQRRAFRRRRVDST